MDDKDNFYRTRDLCEDLSKILNMTNPGVHNFLRIFELALIHKLVEENINKENKDEQIRISVPFICDLFLSIKDGDVVIDNVVLEDRFKKHVLDAILENKSPLILEAESSLIRRIKNRYDSLI